MGEMTEAVLDGESCEWCGVFFAKKHGFPVVCETCWDTNDAKQRCGHQLATEKEL